MLHYIKQIFLSFILILATLGIKAQTAMPDNTCIGTTKHYNVDPNSTPGSTYIWRVDGITQTNFTNNEINITWNSIGTYTLDVQETTAGGCIGPLKSGLVFVYFTPTILAYSNSPVCEGALLNLSTQSIPEGIYLWTGPNGYTSTDQNPQISSPLQINAGNYFVTVSANGCTSEAADIAVIINDCFDFFIPEGFSPNGDGVNDLFVIRGIDHFPNNTFTIFNRWGNKIFETNHYQNTWNGTSTMGLRIEGNELPIGTYFYTLDLHNQTAVYKGTIYLDK
jgi:gliding motility-associated-like protein